MRGRLSILASTAVATTAVALVGVAGCGSTSPGSGRTSGTGAGPATAVRPSEGGGSSTSTQPAVPTTAPRTSVTPGAPASVGVRVYLVRPGGTLAPVHRVVQVRGGATAAGAVTALLSGPTAAERAAGFTTTVPSGMRLRGVTIAGGTADVDLSGPFGEGGGSASMIARVAQVVYTLTQFTTVRGVNILLDGEPLVVLGGEGLVLDRPATRAQFTSVLPPIFIDVPAWGQTVTSPVTVSGSADVFEGQFVVEVRNDRGGVLARRSATAAMGQQQAFTVSLPFTVSGTARGQVVGYDRSPRDGSVVHVFAVPVSLRTGGA